MEYEFSMIHEALSDFARKHGHYPNSLSEVPGLKDCNFVDPWGNSFYYEKTPQGFRLLSLGRDGEPGGVGLDADIDSDRENRIPYEPTLSQFLFESAAAIRYLWSRLWRAFALVWWVISQAGRRTIV